MSDNGNDQELILRIRNLKKTYMQGRIPVYALKDVSFDVKKGEFISIVAELSGRDYNPFYLVLAVIILLLGKLFRR